MLYRNLYSIITNSVCLQWGMQNSNITGIVQVTFPTSFLSKNYVCGASSYRSTRTEQGYGYSVNKTESCATFIVVESSACIGFNWWAIGF